MEHDETSKLADVQTKPADLLVGDLADEVKTGTKNPKRVEQGKRLAEWNKANKRRQLLEATSSTPEPALKHLEATSSSPEPALKQLKAPKSSFETKGDTKDYFLIGETILIIGLLSVGLFCYTTSLASTDKTQFEDAKVVNLKPPKKLSLNQLSLKLKLEVPKKLSL